MATHDTDPDRPPRAALLGATTDPTPRVGSFGPDERDLLLEATDPGSPPTVTEPGSSGIEAPAVLASELLAHVARAPLPENGVRETEGHDAAAVAVGAHAPPKRHTLPEARGSQPAVLINTTQPLDTLPTLPREDGARTGRGGDAEAAALPQVALDTSKAPITTVASARVHRQRSIIKMAALGVLSFGILTAGVIVAIGQRPDAATPAPPSLTSSAASASSVASAMGTGVSETSPTSPAPPPAETPPPQKVAPPEHLPSSAGKPPSGGSPKVPSPRPSSTPSSASHAVSSPASVPTAPAAKPSDFPWRQ